MKGKIQIIDLNLVQCYLHLNNTSVTKRTDNLTENKK